MIYKTFMIIMILIVAYRTGLFVTRADRLGEAANALYNKLDKLEKALWLNKGVKPDDR